MNMDRVAYYRRRIGEGENFPSAVALYLNGAVPFTVIFIVGDGNK